MNKTEIKKALYKQKPVAEFTHIRRGIAYYNTILRIEEEPYTHSVFFEIPVDDMGDADFDKQMDANLLNRWIVDILILTKEEGDLKMS